MHPTIPAALSPGWKPFVKRFLPGRMLAAALRHRRAPLSVLRGRRTARDDRRMGRIAPPAPRRRSVRSVVCFVSGPGRPAELLDSIESVLVSDGESSQVVVIDDFSIDSREALVRERYPEVAVVPLPVPSGGPPRMWPHVALALHHARECYDFELFVRLDTDALVVGPGLSQRALEAVGGADRAAIAGSVVVRADGEPEDHGYHARVVRGEQRYDRALARAVDAAFARRWTPGRVVQGGALCVTRAGVDAMASGGWLGYRQPWHSNATDDLLLSIFASAAGAELVSIGGPGGIFAVANKHLPVATEELAEGRWLVAHSTRLGFEGEDEATLRERFRASRATWDQAAVRAR